LGRWQSRPGFAAGSPNEKLNVVVIGCGGRGSQDLQGCLSENIVALCDVDGQPTRRKPMRTSDADTARVGGCEHGIKRDSQKKKPAMHRLRYGIVGAGFVAALHVRAFCRVHGTEVTGIVTDALKGKRGQARVRSPFRWPDAKQFLTRMALPVGA